MSGATCSDLKGRAMPPSSRDRALIKKFADKWKRELFLHEWFINIIHMKAEHPDRAYASCHASVSYLEADISIYPRFWELDKDGWERTIVHELCHCITSKVSRMLDDALNGKLHPVTEVEFHIEQLTQRIANAVMGK